MAVLPLRQVLPARTRKSSSLKSTISQEDAERPSEEAASNSRWLLHQLSHMGTEERPGELRKLFQEYGILDEIDWIQIKELYRVNFPDGTGISLPTSRKECQAHLAKLFPKEKEGIDHSYDAVYRFLDEANAFAAKSAASTGELNVLKKAIMKVGFPKLYPTLAKYGLKSTQEVLDECFQNKSSRWRFRPIGVSWACPPHLASHFRF